VDVIVNPLMKSVWLTATPVNPQSIKRNKCSFFIPAFVLPIIQTSQNKIKLMPTRSTFNP
jgi:hypothetical protein